MTNRISEYRRKVTKCDSRVWEESVCAWCARVGDLEALQHVHETMCLKWDARVLMNAIGFKNMKCFEYAVENGCIPTKDTFIVSLSAPNYLHLLAKRFEDLLKYDYEEILYVAANRGCIDALKILIETKTSCDCVIAFHMALKNGYFECAEILFPMIHTPIPEYYKNIYTVAVDSEYPEKIIKFLLDKQFPKPRDLAEFAASRGDLESLSLAYFYGFPWTDWVLRGCIARNCLKCLDYIIRNGLGTIELALESAIVHDNREIIAYIMRFDFPRRVEVTRCVARRNSPECLWTLVSHKNPFPVDIQCMEEAVFDGNVESIDILRTVGCPWNAGICKIAAEQDNIEILKYAHENGCPWDETVPRGAAENSCLNCLKYSICNGCPWNKNIIEVTHDKQCESFLLSMLI